MIQFKKITVHNFGSYAHAELDLQNKGFCLVSGQNNYIKDGAASNGSGKSAIFSAICYALTGETVGGIRSGLKNINVEEKEESIGVNLSGDNVRQAAGCHGGYKGTKENIGQ